MLKKTPFWSNHEHSGGRMVDFASWSMPIQYGTGIIKETEAVRQNVGMFDVSHMARIEYSGSESARYLDYVLGADIAKLSVGAAKYTLICNADGGIIDDCIIYRLSGEKYLLVINAACKDADLDWLEQCRTDFHSVAMKDVTADIVMISVQGAKAMAVMDRLTNGKASEIKPFTLQEVEMYGFKALLARTGYTGEDGVEAMFDAKYANAFWNGLIKEGVMPCGLGARDVLRLEAGLMLYGNDITVNENPFEAALGWTIRLKKEADYVARDALVRLKESPPARQIVGIRITEAGVPRRGMALYSEDGSEIGMLTSGTFSPTLQVGIGMGYVKKEYAVIDAPIKVKIREQVKSAQIVKLPFYKRVEK